jgi:hypothetical protein
MNECLRSFFGRDLDYLPSAVRLMVTFDENRQAETCPTGYFAGLGVAGSRILLVNEFSSDHTQGYSPISSPVFSFRVL